MFEVTLIDESVELVAGADSFQQEGPMTTFFGSDGRHRTLDYWSTKVASFRTDRIVKIRMLSAPDASPRDRDHDLRDFANAS